MFFLFFFWVFFVSDISVKFGWSKPFFCFKNIFQFPLLRYYSDSKPTTTDKKTKTKTWQPTNISKAQVLQLKKTALNKKRRQADKKKTKKNKADEVTRVLGPMQQPPAKTGAGKKSKMTTKKKKAGKGSKVARKGSQGRRWAVVCVQQIVKSSGTLFEGTEEVLADHEERLPSFQGKGFYLAVEV